MDEAYQAVLRWQGEAREKEENSDVRGADAGAFFSIQITFREEKRRRTKRNARVAQWKGAGSSIERSVIGAPSEA